MVNWFWKRKPQRRTLTLRSRGEIDRASADFDQAIKLKPGLVAALYARGLA